MSKKSQTKTENKNSTENRVFIQKLRNWINVFLPVILLLTIAIIFISTTPFAQFSTGEPLPDVTISNVKLPTEETISFSVTNNGPEPVEISQVLIDDAYWNFQMIKDGKSVNKLGSRETARIVVPYHWTSGWDFDIALVLSSGVTFHHTIIAASETPGFSLDILWSLAFIGLFVGIIPVALGMLWFPYIKKMSDRWIHAVLAFSVGILGFLAVDAGLETFELAEDIPGFLEGKILAVLAILGTLLIIQAVSSWRQNFSRDKSNRLDGKKRGLWVAYLVALAVGLHNLAEGLAIGSAFSLGRVSLGSFLVLGFMLHNITEGPAIVAPAAKGRRPSVWHFGALGLLAGGPTILGGWIGGFAYSSLLGTLFLAIGIGAIFQVIWELVKMVKNEGGKVTSPLNLLVFTFGFIIMYATDIFITI